MTTTRLAWVQQQHAAVLMHAKAPESATTDPTAATTTSTASSLDAADLVARFAIGDYSGIVLTPFAQQFVAGIADRFAATHGASDSSSSAAAANAATAASAATTAETTTVAATTASATEVAALRQAYELAVQQSLVAALTSPASAPKEDTELAVTIVAASLLALFVRANWTGPGLSETDVAGLQLPSARLPNNISVTDMRAMLIDLLTVDGEEPYRPMLFPELFVLSKLVLVDNASLLSSSKIATAWWSMRCLRIHNELIGEPTSLLHELSQEAVETVSKNVAALSSESDVQSRALLECALSQHLFANGQESRVLLSSAQKAAGLELNLSGALGRRTKFQSFDTAQLVLQATSVSKTVADEQAAIPQQAELNDDLLLDDIKLKEKDEKLSSNLRVLDQCIILAICLDVKNNNPAHGLTTEEMFPYVSRVLANPNNWMVHTFGLLLRSRLETEKSRTVERSVMQLQTLVDQFNDPESVATVALRMEWFFALEMPALWSLKRELGSRYKSLGVLRTAIDLFENLQLWEDVIECYQMLDKGKQAEQLIRDQLAISERPKLYCLLGDVTNDAECYLRAWNMSGQRYPRAMRGLGYMYLRQEKFQECIECFELALAINPIYAGVWFSLGCAAIRVGDYEKVANAFRRVVALQPDDAEAWNNLATAYIKLKEKERAFHALLEAIKEKFDSWRIWENLLFVSIDILDFDTALRAFNRMLDLQDKYLDIQVVMILVRAVTENLEDRFGNKTQPRLRAGVEKLLDRITSGITNNQEVWAVCATFYAAFGEKDKQLDSLLKAYRAAQKPGWERDPAIFPTVAETATHLCEAYLADGTSKSLHSAKLLLASLIKKTEDSFFAHSSHADLQALLAKVTASS